MKQPCRHPGCSVLLDASGYCEAHKKNAPNKRRTYEMHSRRSTPELLAAMEFRNSGRWKQVRRQKMSRDPLCEDPYQQHERRGTTETGRQVHHVIGLAECAGDDRAYTMDNLMTVCWGCHARLERDEKRKTT